MTRSSCITHPPRGRFLIIRQEYVDICQGAKYPLCAAAILHVFEHWTNFKLDAIEAEQRDVTRAIKAGKKQKAIENRWVHMAQDDLKMNELFGLFGESAVAKSLKELLSRKFLKSRRNPSKKWDRTLQYWLEIETVQKAIDATLPVESQDAPIPYQHDIEDVPARHRSLADTEAIPQDSTQDSITDISSGEDAGISKTPRKPRKRNEAADAVTIHFFETELGTNPETEKQAAIAAAWMAGGNAPKVLNIQPLEQGLTIDEIIGVARFFRVKNPDASMPRSLTKIARWTWDYIAAGKPATPTSTNGNGLHLTPAGKPRAEQDANESHLRKLRERQAEMEARHGNGS